MEQKFHLGYSDFLNRVYRQEKPNTFLAQFVPFLLENINYDYCLRLVESSFEELVSRNISQYSNYRTLPVCFVGSVAYHFSKQLLNVLERQKLRAGKILKDPMESLVQYHLSLI